MFQKVLNFKWHILILGLCVLIASSTLYGFKSANAYAEQDFVINVKPGMTANNIGKLLSEKGVVKSAVVFNIAAKIKHLDSSLQAGAYVVNKDMSIPQIIDKLSNGITDDAQLTIPEGYTVDQIAKLIQEKGLGDAVSFANVARSYSPYDYMTNDNPNVVYKSEGYIFPDTYNIEPGITEEQLLDMLVSQFDKKLTPEMRARANELGLSVKDVIILASLVEKEAKLEQDRALIAGVFLNRLKKDMPLQSCATIQYILGNPKAELSVQDTKIASPYNTYQNAGLPPGPIANPGIASINAVLYPTTTDYLYFVADANGAHHFSVTYEEHLAAIEQVSK